MLNTISWITQNYFVNSDKIKIKTMARYHFYSRNDSTQEPIMTCITFSRLKAAKYFAERKQLPLKTFLSLFAISK